MKIFTLGHLYDVGQRPLQSTSPAGQANISAAPYKTVVRTLYRMYFALVILPRPNCTNVETKATKEAHPVKAIL
jgi:hypothetical protein